MLIFLELLLLLFKYCGHIGAKLRLVSHDLLNDCHVGQWIVGSRLALRLLFFRHLLELLEVSHDLIELVLVLLLRLLVKQVAHFAFKGLGHLVVLKELSFILVETLHEGSSPFLFVLKVFTHLGDLFFSTLESQAHLLHLCFKFSDLGFIFLAEVFDIIDENFKFLKVALLLMLFEQCKIRFKLLVVLV